MKIDKANRAEIKFTVIHNKQKVRCREWRTGNKEVGMRILACDLLLAPITVPLKKKRIDKRTGTACLCVISKLSSSCAALYSHLQHLQHVRSLPVQCCHSAHSTYHVQCYSHIVQYSAHIFFFLFKTYICSRTSRLNTYIQVITWKTLYFLPIGGSLLIILLGILFTG